MARSKPNTRKPSAKDEKPRLLTPERRREIVGAALVAVAVITVLAFFSQNGALTQRWIGLLEWALGWGVVLSPFIIGGLGAWLIWETMERQAALRWERPLGAAVFLLTVLGLVHLFTDSLSDQPDIRALAAAHRGGGWFGYGVAMAFTDGLGTWPGVAALLVVAVVATSLMAGLTLRDTTAIIGRAGRGTLRAVWALISRLRARPAAGAGPQVPPPGPAAHEGRVDGGRPAAVAAGGSAGPAGVPAVVRRPDPSRRDWRLPDVDEVFEPTVEIGASPDDSEGKARVIEQALAEFGIPVRVVEINHGPAITQFGLEPGYVERAGQRSKIKVSQIVALQNDLSLALAASPIRIQAPVPGRPYVGVEVPNAASSLVALRGVLESEAFQRVAQRGVLPLALGRDTSGRAVAADLGAMPHLLVAGATGSGKSVAINAVISTLTVVHTPDTLKMLLIDPKRVELAAFRGLPHLAAPVVVDIERVVGVLQWAVREMDRRYRVFAEAGTRNIAAYNGLMAQRGAAPLPFLVIIVDELADLMMTVPEEAERLITRLAQLARATGIHLVIATQRPSVDVVTGLIKANFPARIAFAVSSGVDSRVILDTSGAEKLLGRGDMLYQASDSSKLRRLQGCFVSDGEIEKLARYWQRLARPGPSEADTSLTLGLPEPLIQTELWEQMGEKAADQAVDERDALWAEAVALIRQAETASTSFLQRKLRVGYSRAARLMDQLEEAGLIGPAQGNQPREVLIGPDDVIEEAGSSVDGGRLPGDQPDESEADSDDGVIRPWLND